jgi:hypothetical protein
MPVVAGPGLGVFIVHTDIIPNKTIYSRIILPNIIASLITSNPSACRRLNSALQLPAKKELSSGH